MIISSEISGNSPSRDAIFPDKESALVNVGSSSVSKARHPPLEVL